MWNIAERVGRVAVAAVLAGVLLAGCASNGSAASNSAEVNAKPAPASEPEPKTEPEPEPIASPSEITVGEMTTLEQAASVVMGHISSTDAATLHEYMATGLGGFIVMDSNVVGSADGTAALTAALTVDPAVPPLVAIDQEGGIVSRLPWDDLPAGIALQHADPDQVTTTFRGRAEQIAGVGANVNFGIVADVPQDAWSFIAPRALGADTDGASLRVAAAVSGEQGIVFSTLKHFPGHGAAPGDSHYGIPATEVSFDEWLAADAQPFEAGINAGAELLMFGHLAYTSVDEAPASLSPRWHDIARDDLGFEGVIITDDLGMLMASGIAEYVDPVENAVNALIAGNDMVLMIAGSTASTATELIEGIVAAVDDGRLSPERLQDAAVRVMELRLSLAEPPVPAP